MSKFKVGDTVTIKDPRSWLEGEEVIITEVDDLDDNWPYFCEVKGDSSKFDWFKEEHLELSKENPWEGLTEQEQECIVDSLEFHLEGCELLEEFKLSEDKAKYVVRLKQLITKLKGE